MIHHVGIVAADRVALASLQLVAPLALVGAGDVAAWDCRCEVYRVGDGATYVELILPRRGKLHEWLMAHGTSLHHVAVRVPDVRAAAAAARAGGARVLSEDPVVGVMGWLINFIHPSHSGLLVELVEER